jgi:DNA-binding NarL/FixJ family response regulator
MMLIVQGMRLTDIASQLIVSVKTISTYRQRILQKLKAGSNAELVQYVIRHGLID